MFIDEEMKPKKKLISESNLEYIFNFDEDTQVRYCVTQVWFICCHICLDICIVLFAFVDIYDIESNIC